MKGIFVRTLVIAILAVLGLACARFEGPPVVTIEGLENGVLTDPEKPIVLSFSKPIDPKSLRVKLARYVVDVEGNLPDEDADEATLLDVSYFRDDEGFDHGGKGTLGEDNKTFSITTDLALPIGAALVILIEPGLVGVPEKGEDVKPSPTVERRRIKFAYTFALDCDAPSILKSGAYFLLADVQKPLHIQVRLFAHLVVDESTGAFLGQFTKADRNPDPNRCPMPCDSTEVCRLIPAPDCVAPSEPAGTYDEFPDYLPNPDPPIGFTFTAHGCSVDQDAKTVAFSAAPVDVEVLSPHVTLRNASLTASFVLGDDDVLRGTGSIGADDVILGTATSGIAEGGLTARSIPEKDAPPGIPPPPDADAGAP